MIAPTYPPQAVKQFDLRARTNMETAMHTLIGRVAVIMTYTSDRGQVYSRADATPLTTDDAVMLPRIGLRGVVRSIHYSGLDGQWIVNLVPATATSPFTPVWAFLGDVAFPRTVEAWNV